MDKLDFNTLDNLVASDQWNDIVEQASRSIKTMQTDITKPTISPHVVLPIFQKKEDTQYVIAISGEQKGPFTLIQIMQMLNTEVITGDCYIWTSGWTEWRLIKDCKEIIESVK